MGKKVREYKAGDFIFAKVKGYPAWPARVQGVNGKKYFIYFYGTGEIANLPPNMIFDYAENKDKFLTKTVKRKDFNDGARQIEHDFANNVPLEEVVGTIQSQALAESSMNVTTEGNDTVTDDAEVSADDTTNVNESISTVNTTQNFDTTVEDSDEGGQLVIDEGKKARKPKDVAKTPAKTPKEPKTPRRSKKEFDEENKVEAAKVEEEIISRSGRKIKPKRYIDEHTPDNATLPSPVPKKRRVPSPEKQKPVAVAGESNAVAAPPESCTKQYNVVNECELAELQEPLNDEGDKENLLLAYLPSGRYVGVRLFQGRPTNFKTPAARLQWERQAAKNAIRLKQELEKGLTNPKSVLTQLETDLNLTKEERSNLDKERELEEKKSRLQYLKTEMKMIDLDAKIKSCITIERVDFEQCFKILDEHLELDIKPLMLLKRPNCMETLKRLRCYAGDAQQLVEVDMDEKQFQEASHTLRSKASLAFNKLKGLFAVPDGLTFWEFFAGRVRLFNNVKEKLTKEQVLEMVHEPPELSNPSAYSMRAAIDSCNENSLEEIKTTYAKNRKSIGKSPSKSPRKQSKQSNESKKSAQSEKLVEQTEANTAAVSEVTKEVEEENKPTDKESTETPETPNNENIVSETPAEDVQDINASSQNEDTNRMDVSESNEDNEKGKTDGNKKDCDKDVIETSEQVDKTKETTDKSKADEATEKDDIPKTKDGDKREEAEKSIDSDKSIDAEKSKYGESGNDSEKGEDAEKNKDSEKSKVAVKRKNSERDRDAEKSNDTEKSKVSEKRKDYEKNKDAEKSKDAEKKDSEKSITAEKNKDKPDKSKEKADKSKENNDKSKDSVKSPKRDSKSSKKDEKSNKKQPEVASEDGKSDENDNDKDKTTSESDKTADKSEKEMASATGEKSLEIKEECVEPRPKRGREASKKFDVLKSPSKKKSRAQ